MQPDYKMFFEGGGPYVALFSEHCDALKELATPRNLETSRLHVAQALLKLLPALNMRKVKNYWNFYSFILLMKNSWYFYETHFNLVIAMVETGDIFTVKKSPFLFLHLSRLTTKMKCLNDKDSKLRIFRFLFSLGRTSTFTFATPFARP